MKVVINRCFGGFKLSKEAYKSLGMEWDGYGYKYAKHECRTKPELIWCIEKLGTEAASGVHASLKIVEVPDDVEWEIEEYDGREWVAEKHRVWC